MIKASYKDKDLVIDLLSNAFDENKSVNDVAKRGKGRKKRIKRLFGYSFRMSLLFGEVLLSDDKRGCALIIYPHKKRATIYTLLLDIKLAFSVVGISRAKYVLEREMKIHKFHPKTPYCHIWFLGVDYRFRNKGIGSSLLTEIIQDNYQKETPVYLETSVSGNLSFYQKSGFEIYDQIDLGYNLYFLKRELN